MLIQKDIYPENLQLAEITRLEEWGINTGDLKTRIEAEIRSSDYAYHEEAFWKELEELAQQPTLHNEPSDWVSIENLKPGLYKPCSAQIDKNDIYDRVYGAWLGRCAGCVLGKPVEIWTRQKIEAYLHSVDAFPLKSYLPVRTPFADGLQLNPCHPVATLGNIHFMPRDDDLDYTILGLYILETYGRDFTANNVAQATFGTLPFNLVYTAEAIAYRNLVNGLTPPQTASYRNPYQEWIGAQIRADMWGYVNPGNPQRAAEFAFRDASYTHTGVGIYGEMWAAACIAVAFIEDDPLQVIQAGLSVIPEDNRLSEAISSTLKWTQESKDWKTIWERIHAEYGHYHPIHVIPNTCFIVMGLILGEGDLEKSICTTVMAGGDTDCTGATVGSMVGAMKGYKKLPEKWIAPLQDRVKSLILNFQDMKISDLAKRTCLLIKVGD